MLENNFEKGSIVKMSAREVTIFPKKKNIYFFLS